MLNGFRWIDEDMGLIMNVVVYNIKDFGGCWGLLFVWASMSDRREVSDCQYKKHVSYRHIREKVDD